jgi:LacI family transcriptional regulator
LRPEWYIEVPYRLDDARQAVRTLLSLKERPTAVVCGNDVIAYGVMLEAERQGLTLPDDLSVMGFDDLEWSRHLRPSLTTMHVPTDEVWARAGDYLVKTLSGVPATLHHEVDVSLVVRESTAPIRLSGHRPVESARRSAAAAPVPAKAVRPSVATKKASRRQTG